MTKLYGEIKKLNKECSYTGNDYEDGYKTALDDMEKLGDEFEYHKYSQGELCLRDAMDAYYSQYPNVLEAVYETLEEFAEFSLTEEEENRVVLDFLEAKVSNELTPAEEVLNRFKYYYEEYPFGPLDSLTEVLEEMDENETTAYYSLSPEEEIEILKGYTDYLENVMGIKPQSKPSKANKDVSNVRYLLDYLESPHWNSYMSGGPLAILKTLEPVNLVEENQRFFDAYMAMEAGDDLQLLKEYTDWFEEERNRTIANNQWAERVWDNVRRETQDKKEENQGKYNNIRPYTGPVHAIVYQEDPTVQINGAKYSAKEFQELCDAFIGQPKLNDKQQEIFDYWVQQRKILGFDAIDGLTYMNMLWDNYPEKEGERSFLSSIKESYEELSLEEEAQLIQAFLAWNINYTKEILT